MQFGQLEYNLGCFLDVVSMQFFCLHSIPFRNLGVFSVDVESPVLLQTRCAAVLHTSSVDTAVCSTHHCRDIIYVNSILQRQ